MKSSGGRSSGGRNVIVIENKEEVPEVSKEKEPPVCNRCPGEGSHLEEVMDSESEREVGTTSSNIQPCMPILSMKHFPFPLSQN